MPLRELMPEGTKLPPGCGPTMAGSCRVAISGWTAVA